MYLNHAWEFYFCSSLVLRELGQFPRRKQLISKSWLNPGLYLPWSGVWVLLEIPKVTQPSACGWGRRWKRKRWVKEKQILSHYRETGNEEWGQSLLSAWRLCMDFLLGSGIPCLPQTSRDLWSWKIWERGLTHTSLGSIPLIKSSLQQCRSFSELSWVAARFTNSFILTDPVTFHGRRTGLWL